MNVVHEYFVASDEELTQLRLADHPVGQLPAERAAGLTGLDPTVALLALIEVLSTLDYDALLARAEDTLIHDGGDDGPWVSVVDGFLVDAVRGADGDPEMEWDDAVLQWRKLADEELTDIDDDALLAMTDTLRRLCGEARGDQRLYCWTAMR